MSTETDPKELLNKVQDEEVRSQLETVFDDLSGSALRQQVEDLKAENKTFKQQARSRAFQDAGFDPESGPGKALAKLYEGEPDPEQIKQVAEEYGLNPTGTDTQAPDAGEQRAAGEDRLAQVQSGAIPNRDPSAADKIKQAETKAKDTGDWSEFDRLQAQAVSNLGR